MKRILILTAGFGEGHNTAARCLRDALQPEAEVEVMDLFGAAYGVMNEFARRSYLRVINQAPKIWEWIYKFFDSGEAFEETLPLFYKMQRLLQKLLAESTPDIVVSTYPVYNYLIDRIYPDRKPFHQITVVTDSITVNSIWYRASSDIYIVPNTDTAEVMRGAGVSDAKMKVLGFPVTHKFATERIDLPSPSSSGECRVLYMINSARGEACELVKKLLEIPKIRLTVTAGKDAELKGNIEEIVKGTPTEVYGWTDKMPELLMKNHLLISKAGGATVQETIAARTPMIISQVVPGQEEGNAQLLIRNKCGALEETTEDIVTKVKQVFDENASLWSLWHDNITKLSRPDASLRIAEYLLAL